MTSINSQPHSTSPAEGSGASPPAQGSPSRPLGLLVLTALALYGTWRVAQPFVGGLTWALAFAVITVPMQRRLERRLKKSWLAAALSVMMVACLLLVPAIFVAHRMVLQTVIGLQTLDTQGAEYWRQFVERVPRAADVAAWLGTLDVQDGLRELTSRLPLLVRGSIGAAAELFIALFCLFFFLRDRAVMLAYLRSLLPLSTEQVDALSARISETIHATIFGRLLIAFAQGALGGLMFWWLGLPAPLAWTLVMSFFALVPALGPFLVWGPAALWLAFGGAWSSAIAMTLWGLLVVSLIDNALYPFLVGARMQMHPLVVFVSVVGGLGLFGASGLVLGPVLLAVTAALLDLWRTPA